MACSPRVSAVGQGGLAGLGDVARLDGSKTSPQTFAGLIRYRLDSGVNCGTETARHAKGRP